MKEPRFGGQIPQDKWIQKTLKEDPHKHIPFLAEPPWKNENLTIWGFMAYMAVVVVVLAFFVFR